MHSVLCGKDIDHSLLHVPYVTAPYIGFVTTKPVFGVSDKAILKPACSATETSWKTKVLLVASLVMVLSSKRITKALVRLRAYAGWSASLLFANPQRQVFSHRGPYMIDYGIEEQDILSFFEYICPMLVCQIVS